MLDIMIIQQKLAKDVIIAATAANQQKLSVPAALAIELWQIIRVLVLLDITTIKQVTLHAHFAIRDVKPVLITL